MKGPGYVFSAIMIFAGAVDAWVPAAPLLHRKDVSVGGVFDDFKSMGGIEKSSTGNLTPGEVRSAKRKAARAAEAEAKGGAVTGVSKSSAEDQIKKLKADTDSKLPSSASGSIPE